MGHAHAGSSSQESCEWQMALGAKRKPAARCSTPGGRTQPCPCLRGLGTLVPGSPHVCSEVALTAGAAEHTLEATHSVLSVWASS